MTTVDLRGLTPNGALYAAALLGIDSSRQPSEHRAAELAVLGLARIEQRHEDAAAYALCRHRGVDEAACSRLLKGCIEAGEHESDGAAQTVH